MQIIQKIDDLKLLLQTLRLSGSVGLIPTMGALHEGHLTLVKESISNDEITVASIYVNPTQFNDKNDLQNYPRNFEEDCAKLKSLGCDIVFAPEDEEMYPEPDTRTFNLNGLDKVMEGEHRPGHFNGVAQIVSKLFDIVQPDKAYFGEKDYQQVAVIKHLVASLSYDVEIVTVPTVREDDGLAMSSRNLLLTKKHREAAPVINRILKSIIDVYSSKTPGEIKTYVQQEFANQPLLNLEYIELVNSKTLQPIHEWIVNTSVTACIAVFAGKIRLIDNISFNIKNLK